MTYKEKVRQIYPNSRLFNDILTLHGDEYKYVICIRVYKDNSVNIIRGCFDHSFYKFYQNLGLWKKTPKLAWQSAYECIQEKLIETLSL